MPAFLAYKKIIELNVFFLQNWTAKIKVKEKKYQELRIKLDKPHLVLCIHMKRINILDNYFHFVKTIFLLRYNVALFIRIHTNSYFIFAKGKCLKFQAVGLFVVLFDVKQNHLHYSVVYIFVNDVIVHLH